jgi:hypothetical protein
MSRRTKKSLHRNASESDAKRHSRRYKKLFCDSDRFSVLPNNIFHLIRRNEYESSNDYEGVLAKNSVIIPIVALAGSH